MPFGYFRSTPAASPSPTGAASPASSAEPAAASDPSARGAVGNAKNVYLNTFKKCFTKPEKTIIKHPILTLVYDIAIKVLFYSISGALPVFAWAAIAFSTALFERAVILHPKKYGNAMLDAVKDTWENVLVKKWRERSTSAPASAGSAPPATSS